MLKEVSGQWTVADWSPDETKVAAVESISINESYIHIVEIATGEIETITPRRADAKSGPVAASDPKWSHDGRSLYYVTDKGSELRRLVHHHLASGNVEMLTDNISWDVEEFDVSDDGDLIAWAVNDGGVSQIWVGRSQGLGLQNSFPFFGLPKGVISSVKFRPGSHEIGFTLSTARRLCTSWPWK